MALAYAVLCGVLFSAISAGHGDVVKKYFLRGDEACSSDQSNSIFDCLHLMGEEMLMISSEAKEIANLTSILFQQNQLNSFTSALKNDADSSGLFGFQPSLESGPGQPNLAEIIRILLSHRNQTMELIQATCRGMNKFVSCSEEAIQGSECKPIMYRGAKVSSEMFCDEEFQETMILLLECLLVIVQDPRMDRCLAHVSETVRPILMDSMLGDEKSLGDAMCRITAIVLESFRPMMEECDSQVFELYARMSNMAILAMFDTECGTNATISDKFGDKIAMDRDGNVKNGSELIVVNDESPHFSKYANDPTNEPMVEEKATLVADANEMVAVEPVKMICFVVLVIYL